MIVTGRRQAAVERRIWAHALVRAIRHGGGPLAGLRALRAFRAERRRDLGPSPSRKYVYAGGRHFAGLYLPGFPSPAFDRLLDDAFQRLRPRGLREPGLQSVVLAVTGECPLDCAHCCEARVAASGLAASPEQVRETLRMLQEHGVAQVFLSGGEPLVRFESLLALLESARPGTDFWVFTSGWRLDAARAERLRAAGLTGVAVSLDHWDPAAHDAFRRRPGAFAMAERACAAARDAGLVVALSLCATRSFVSRENLRAYCALATRWGADFVQLLEPKPAGRWQGCDVLLGAEQRALLEELHDSANREPAMADAPAVAYLELIQRRAGCLGSGHRYLYVDSAGAVHPCPFCRAAVGRLPDQPLDTLLPRLRSVACGAGHRRHWTGGRRPAQARVSFGA